MCEFISIICLCGTNSVICTLQQENLAPLTAEGYDTDSSARSCPSIAKLFPNEGTYFNLLKLKSYTLTNAFKWNTIE